MSREPSVRIPAKVNAYSEGNVNGIPSRRRTLSERSDAGVPIVPEVVRLRQWKCPERSEGSLPVAEKGVWGKGRQPLSPLQHAEARRALARRLSAALFAHRIAAHLDTVCVMNESVENTVGSSGVADLFMPASHRKLGS